MIVVSEGYVLDCSGRLVPPGALYFKPKNDDKSSAKEKSIKTEKFSKKD